MIISYQFVMPHSTLTPPIAFNIVFMWQGSFGKLHLINGKGQPTEMDMHK